MDYAAFERPNKTQKIIEENTFIKYIGKNTDFVINTLKNEFPNMQLVSLNNNSVFICDYRLDRIKVFSDNNDKLQEYI